MNRKLHNTVMALIASSSLFVLGLLTAALAAAIDPADGPWKYYVLTQKSPPAHFFTDDYDEFLEAKSDAQADGVF